MEKLIKISNLRVNCGANQYILGQEVRTGSCRKTPEIDGTWKQYSGRKVPAFFPVNPDYFLALSYRKRSEKSKKIPVGILFSCSIDFRSFSAGSGDRFFCFVFSAQ